MPDEIIEIMARAIDEGSSYLLPGDDHAAPFRRAAFAVIEALKAAGYEITPSTGALLQKGKDAIDEGRVR